MRKKLKPWQVDCKYGPSPDKPTTQLARATNCPLFVVRQVPVECELFQDIFNKATDVLSLQKGKQLVYKGESASQLFERLRIEVSRPRRRQLTNAERQTVVARQNNACHVCGSLSEKYELDHAVQLCDGGGDDIDNLRALCPTCHADKSERERLGALYRTSLESHLSTEVLEAIYDAPKPQQVVVGDGTESCLKVDAIRCRSNALLKNSCPLPVASVVDELQQYGPSISDDEFQLSTTADFYFIDAGEPLDNPLDALPHMGPTRTP